MLQSVMLLVLLWGLLRVCFQCAAAAIAVGDAAGTAVGAAVGAAVSSTAVGVFPVRCCWYCH